MSTRCLPPRRAASATSSVAASTKIEKRLRDIGEARIRLEEVISGAADEPSGTIGAIAAQRRSVVPWLLSVVVGLALAALAFVHFREVPAVVPLISSSLNPPEGTSTDPGVSTGVGTPELCPDGKWIIFAARAADNKAPLWLRPLSSSTPQITVAERVSWVLTAGYKGVFTVSGSGLLAYQTGGFMGQHKLAWFDRTGKVVGTLGESGGFSGIELSPDRTSAAVTKVDATGNMDVWIHDIARNLPTRFTFDPAQDRQPVWSPDGRALVWTKGSGKRAVLRKSADGNGTEDVLYEDARIADVTSWSTDGKVVLVDRLSSNTGIGIWSLPITPEKRGSPLQPAVFADAPFDQGRGVFSPDGRWVAYTSGESQQFEIYVMPFPGPGGKRQISTSGGLFARWRHDGKEIFYSGLDGRLMAAELTLKDSSVDVGQVKPLGITVPTTQFVAIPYDVSLDGQRILAITESERSSPIPLTLIQNWISLLKK